MGDEMDKTIYNCIVNFLFSIVVYFVVAYITSYLLGGGADGYVYTLSYIYIGIVILITTVWSAGNKISRAIRESNKVRSDDSRNADNLKNIE